MLTTMELLRQEWTTFRRPGRLIGMASAALAIIALGLLYASANRPSCPGTCPATPIGPDGSVVSDQFYFLHRDLGPNGSITVRMTSMTGTITYPPPDHDEIVSGLVPWAKAGIIIKDGVRQGSAYAALMMTGSHGIRMQHNYEHDIAGSPGGVSPQRPRWLRLTRAGDAITGYESADGIQWSEIGTTVLAGLPETVQVGLFATSPGDLTLRRVALGGAAEESRFTQATGVFDNISLESTAPDAWRSEPVGEMNHTDWEKYHNPSGVVERNGTVTISGAGDIGPIAMEGGIAVERTLLGLTIALIIILVVAVRFLTKENPQRPTRRALTAKALVVGAATLVVGLAAVGLVIPLGYTILKGNGAPVTAISAITGVRLVAGVSAALALSAIIALALAALLRRGWAAIVVAISLIALPYAVAAFPLLPDTVSQWLLRLTPAAGLAIQQTAVEYPQVIAHYAPSAGYFPLPGWAGLTVQCAYTLALITIALLRSRPANHPVSWR